MNLLLVEDDSLLAQSACLGLAQRGFVVDWVTRMGQVRPQLEQGDYRCLLLDLSLPDGDGLSLLRHLRKQDNPIPVVIITARDELELRIQGLEAGADDYLTKPYSLDELAARVRAVVRRSDGRPSNRLLCGSLMFDPASNRVTLDGEPVTLSAAECRLLRYFMENPGQVLGHERLMRVLHGDEEDRPDSNVLQVHIYHLRRKLGSWRIRTVRGMGYLLVENEPA